MQRCRVALYLPTRCRVPSSAHDLPRLSPVGTKPDAHRIGSRAPLGLALRAAELQVCIPMVCPIPQTAGRPLPAYPFPLAGRLSVSLHTLVHGRLTVGVKRQTQSVKGNTSHTSQSLHSHARDMERVPRSQTRFRVAIPRVNPGSESVQPYNPDHNFTPRSFP